MYAQSLCTKGCLVFLSTLQFAKSLASTPRGKGLRQIAARQTRAR